MERRLALTINYGLAPGATLDIYPLSSIIPTSPSGMDRMEVLLTSVPGVAHGTIYRVSGTEAYPWGSGAPNVFTVGAGNDRISGGEGFRYVNNGTGDGTTESIPVKFRDSTGFTTASDTIVITISSHLTPPTITTQPNTFIQIPPGGTATMSIAGAGTPAPTYQWYTGIAPDTTNPIAGATGTSYTTPSLAAVQQYHYWCQVKNSGGVANSQGVTVQVATATAVATSNVSTTYQATAHGVTVAATVSPAENTGNVTFTVVGLGLRVVSPTVTNGATGNVTLTLPAGAAAGTYDLNAEYDAPAGIASSTDDKTLTIARANTTTAAGANQATAASTSNQTLTLSATVTSPAGKVNEGTVTFQLLKGATAVGTATTSATVANGAASVAYTLPANTPAGTYTVSAVYNSGGDFNGSSDTTHTVGETPVVTSSSTVLAASASSLTIQGTGFDPNAANDTVTFSNGVSGTVSAATATQLTVSNLTGLVDRPLMAFANVNGASNPTAVQVALVNPRWLSTGAVATWNWAAQTLAVAGAATITGDPTATSDTPVVTVAAGGVLTINPASGHIVHVSGLTVADGGQAVVPPSGGGPNVVVVGSGSAFSLANTGKLDLNNNALDVVGASLATVRAMVVNGNAFAGGGAKGITSSTATADAAHLTAVGVVQNNQTGTPLYSAANPFNGVTPGASDVLVRYTYFGDANLDGRVTAADYTRVDAAFVAGTPTPGWFNGDFNADNVVDGSDYSLTDNAFNRQAAAAGAAAAAVDFSGGFATAGAALAVNGNASVVGSALQVTPNVAGQAGSAYFATKLSVARFYTSFTFATTAGAGTGDGFTFVIQNNGPAALGAGGGSLGYQGMTNSVAVKFDLYSNSGEGPDSTGLYVGGSIPTNVGSVDLSSTGIDLHAGRPIRADLSYSGTVLTVALTDTVTGATATQSYAVDIATAVGGPTAYFGFAGATGGVSAQQSISAWTLFAQ